MSGSLSGRVALVIGASSGIGEAAAVALADAGAKVGVSARRADRLKELVDRIQKAGGEALALPGDASDEGAATAIVADAAKHFGRLDILVNSAGVNSTGGVQGADVADWRRVMDINLWATLYASKAAIEPMLEHGGGDIINISSTAGRRAAGVFGPYTASKHALNGMTEGMRQELGGKGIRVCVIEPGATSTEIAESISDPAYREAIHQHVHKDGAMQAEDIGAAIVFVTSLPRRANVTEILIQPTIDTAPI